MIEMRSLSISDREIIVPFMRKWRYWASDGAFANLFVWQALYRTRFCVEDGFLFLNGGCAGDMAFCGFMLPLGDGDMAAALEKVREYCISSGVRPKLIGLVPSMRDLLDSLFPGEFEFSENRDEADYIYLSDSLARLPGKKFHAKRNLIAGFLEDYYGRFSLEDISGSNIDDVRAFQEKWLRGHGSPVDMMDENDAIGVFLDNFDALEAKGIALRIDGEIAAYTMGTSVDSDLFVVEFEKADASVRGAYQFINRSFAERLTSYKYLNREDDMGMEGLRKAKLSYHPDIVLMKYEAVWRKDGHS